MDSSSWDYWRDLSPEVVEELKFWKQNISSLSGYSFVPSLSQTDVSYEVASDASEVGLFIYEVKCGSFAWKRALTPEEAEQSSTSRELMCFEDFYTHYGERLRGQSVVHYTDSDNVARMLQIGS